MNLSKKLLDLRTKNELTQQAVADMMRERGFSISVPLVSRWEAGDRKVTAEELFALCEIYHVDDIKQTFTGVSGVSDDLLAGLNYTGRQHAKEFVKLLLNNSMFTATEPQRKQHRYIKFYDLAASAGEGNYLDSDSYEEIPVDDTIPYDADFAIKVSGDSMTPRFVHGQTIFVRIQEYLEIGDFGIFGLDGEALLKKWGGNKLISLNSKYKSIKLREYHNLRIFGKVVG